MLRYVHDILNLLMTAFGSYIQDVIHFLDILKDTKSWLSSGHFMDATSLYTIHCMTKEYQRGIVLHWTELLFRFTIHIIDEFTAITEFILDT